MIVALKELAAELSICDKQVLPKFFMPAKWMAVTSRVMKWMPFVKIANHLSVAAPMDGWMYSFPMRAGIMFYDGP